MCKKKIILLFLLLKQTIKTQKQDKIYVDDEWKETGIMFAHTKHVTKSDTRRENSLEESTHPSAAW